ncbi:CHASE2 domain-containing protein [Candidatus Peregrinibacteria bacterium]|nr:CHASE2 domain-containing protein [Candidatus Peregrinibacteria bacterium]
MSVRTHWDNLRSKIEPHMKWVIFLLSSVLSILFLFILLFTQKGWQYPIEVWTMYRGNGQVTQGNIAIVSIDSRTLDSFSRGDIGFLQLGPDHENVIAKTLENLEDYGISKIAVDIVFANTYKDSTNPIVTVIDKYKNIIIAMRAGVGPMASGHYSTAQADCSSKPKKEQKIIA